MELAKIKSKNGDLFVVMNQNRRVALGLIARGGNRPIKLGYFFDLKYYDGAKEKINLHLDRNQAIYVCKFGYLEIRNGNWPTVGSLRDFSFEQWPMPVFENHHSGPELRIYALYDEEQLENQIFSYQGTRPPRDLDLSFVIEDHMAGAFFVAERLERLMKKRDSE